MIDDLRSGIRGQLYPLLLFAAALFYCREALTGRVLMSLNSDAVKCVYSSMSYLHEWMGRGIFPLWNTLSMCGHTFGLHAVSFVNFFNLLAAFWDVPKAYNTVIFFGLFLNGLFMYLFLMRKGISAFSAWMGSLVWMLGVANELDAGFFFMTLCFYLADRYCSLPVPASPAGGRQAGTRRIELALLTLSIALYALNANPHFVLYGCVFLFSYMIFISRRFVRAATPFIFAGGLAMFYYVPLFELVLQSNRGTRHEIFVLLPTHLFQAVFPQIFNSFTRPDLDFMVPRALQGLFSSIPFFKDTEAFLSLPYMGLLPVFALAALCVRRGSPPGRQAGYRFFVLTIIFVGTYLVLHPLIYKLIVRHIPLLQGMTPVGRLLYLYQFSLAVLTGIAVDILLGRSSEVNQIVRRTGFLFLGAGTLVGAGLVGMRVLLEIASGRLAPYLASRFPQGRADEFFYFFREVFSTANPHFLMPLALGAAILALFHLYRRRRLSGRVTKALLCAFVILDMGAILGFAQPASLAKEILAHSEVADFIKRDKGLYRVMQLEDKTRPFHRMFLVPEANMNYGIATPDGYEYLYLRRYVKFYELLTKRHKEVGPYLHTQEELEEGLADFINCKYVVTAAANEKLDGRGGYENIYSSLDYKIYLNQGFLPRAYLVHRQRIVQSFNGALEYVKNNPDRLREEVVLEGEGHAPLEGNGLSGVQKVEIERYEPNRMEVSVESSSEGYLVTSETFYPGWRCFVDGRPAKIEIANTAFQAVRLAPGKHRVQFSFEPFSRSLGLWISVFFALLFLGWVCYPRP